MSSPNFVLIEGYIARGAELREVGTRGNTVLSFTIGVSNGRDKDGESLGSSYFDCEFWNPAEKLGDAIVDASEDEDSSLKVAVRGRLKQDRWKNEDDETRSRVKIAATTVSIPNYSENPNDDDNKGGSRNKKKSSSGRKSGGRSSGGSKSSRSNSGGGTATKKKSNRKTAESNTGRDDDDDDFGDDDDDDGDVPF
ncbi:single-stranded DNA-binding protein [Candidatus Pacearchaeota archaeon]|nr:single-stranded DNA-binding protein [Candidatus Pacearchaeota archaeon]